MTTGKNFEPFQLTLTPGPTGNYLLEATVNNADGSQGYSKTVDFSLTEAPDSKVLAHDVALRYVIPALELLIKGLREPPFRDGVKG